MIFQRAREEVDTKIKTRGGYWSEDQIFGRLVEEVGELARARRAKEFEAKNPRDRDEEREVCDCLLTLLAYANIKSFKLEEKWKEVLK